LGARWMPWRQEPMKGVAGCDKPRGAVNRLRAADSRIGQPARGHARARHPQTLGMAREPGELKHLSTPRNRNQPRFPQ